jgi:hypothetical protein
MRNTQKIKEMMEKVRNRTKERILIGEFSYYEREKKEKRKSREKYLPFMIFYSRLTD